MVVRSHSVQDLGRAATDDTTSVRKASAVDEHRLTMEQHRATIEFSSSRRRDDSNFAWDVNDGNGADSVTNSAVVPEPAPISASTRWAHVRAAAHAVHNLVQVSNDVRLYGARHDDDDIDWQEYLSHSKHKPKWWIIMPDSRFRRPWELFVIILLLYVAVAIPVRVCFDVEVSKDLETLDLMIDMCFVLDVCVNCISAYVDARDGKIHFNQWEILKHYGQTWLFVDLLASIPVYQILDNYSNAESQYNRLGRLARLPRLFRLAKLLRLLKLLRMFRLFRYVNLWQHRLNVNASVARLVKVTFGVSMVTHLIACLWYFCSWSGEEFLHPDSWVVRHGIQDADVSTKYLTSIYWAFSTLTTVGFGDISAFTNLERVFSIICMVLGVTWYAFIISTISNIINTFDRRNAMVRSKMDKVGEFMRMTKLPKILRSRIRDYFHNLYSSSDEGRGFNSEEIIQDLSTSLRTEVVLYMHRRVIPLIPFFKNKSPIMVARIVRMLVPVRCGVGEYIVQEGSHADELYFLTRGRAVVIVQGQKFKGLVEGSLFGEIGCIYAATRTASVRAVTSCEMYALNKRNLVTLMTDFPILADEFRNIAKTRLGLIRKHLEEKGKSKTSDPSLRNDFPNSALSIPNTEELTSKPISNRSRVQSVPDIPGFTGSDSETRIGSVVNETEAPLLSPTRSSFRSRRLSSQNLDGVLAKVLSLEGSITDLQSESNRKHDQVLEAISSLTKLVNELASQSSK